MSFGSNLRQRLFQVGDQVLHVFQSQGDAHEVVHHAEGLAVFHRIIEKRHHGHLGDETLGTAEAGRDEEKFQRVNEPPGCLVIAFHQESDDAAEAAHLFFRQPVIRMRFQSGIPDLFDFGMRFEEARHFESGAIVMFHPQAEGFQSAFQQKAGERSRDGADHPLQFVQVIQQLVIAQRDAGQQIVMAAEIFCGRVDDDVHAQFQRPDIEGRGQRRVNHREQLVPLRDFHDGREVRHTQIGIRRQFGENNVRVGLDGIFDGRRRRVHEAGLNPEFLQKIGREIARLPVAVARENDMAVLFHVGHEREDDRAHAGGKQDGPFGAFNGGELAFGLLLGGIAVAAVFVFADDAALSLGLHELENFGRGLEAVV